MGCDLFVKYNILGENAGEKIKIDSYIFKEDYS